MSHLLRSIFGKQLGAPNPFIRRDIVIVQDRKASNTNGGTLTSGTYTDRDLNTIILDSAGISVLATPNLTLPQGIYDVDAYLQCTGATFGSFKSRIFNTTAAAVLNDINGNLMLSMTSTHGANGGAGSAACVNTLQGRFALAIASQIKFQTISINTSNGGTQYNTGDPEIYLHAKFQRIG